MSTSIDDKQKAEPQYWGSAFLYAAFIKIALNSWTYSSLVQAHALAISRKCVKATYVISGPEVFQRSDMASIGDDAQSVIALRSPALSRYFNENGIALPNSLDRVYSSVLAIKELGYKPKFGVTEFISDNRQPECRR